jgi:hypothetical protein
MKDRDQLLLEQAYQLIYTKGFLIEKVYGNIAVVYHRKKDDPETSSLFTKGIGGANREGALTSTQTQSEIKKAVYGTGLYACYDFTNQLQKEMCDTYGEFVVKGKLDLTNFFFLDEATFNIVRPKEDFLKHLESLRITGAPDKPGFEFHNLYKFKQRVKENKTTKQDRISQIDIAQEVWSSVKRQGFAGFVYLNKDDGKVAVIYNRPSFLPFQYAHIPVKEIKRLLALPEDQREKAVNWVKKNPDIHNIKRSNDKLYDSDFQKQSARDIILLNSTKQSSIGFLNLDLLTDLTKVHFPYIKQCAGEIRLVKYRRENRTAHLSFPALEEAGSIILSLLENDSTIDFGSLRQIKRKLNITISGSVHFNNLESCGEEVWISNPQSDFNLKEIVSLPKLQTCAEIIMHGALKIDLQSLRSCKGGIHAPECMEIILPSTFKGRKKLGKNCKITLI